MRWLSKLIKSSNVVLDKPMSVDAVPIAVMRPRPVKKHAKARNEQRDGGPPPAARPLAGEPVSRADMLSHVKFKSKEIYEQSRKQGVADGFARGMEQGVRDGEKQIQAAENAAADAIEQLKTGNQEEYLKTQAEVESGAMDFAFAVASKILNIHIDRDDPRFLYLFDRITETGAQGDGTDGTELSAQTIALTKAGNADSEINAHTAGGASIAAAGREEDEGPYPGLADIMRLEESDRQRLLNSVDIRDLVVAFRGADEKVTQALLGSFSERMRDTLREELNLSGPMLLSDIEKSRSRVGRIMRKMQKTGEIGNGSERKDDVFV